MDGSERSTGTHAEINVESVLAGCALRGSERALRHLQSLAKGDFSNPDLGEIWDALGEHACAGRPIDPLVIGATLEDRGRRDLVAEVGRCIDDSCELDLRFVDHWAARIRLQSTLRALSRGHAAAHAAINDASIQLDERLEQSGRVVELHRAAEKARDAYRSAGNGPA